MLTLKTRNSEPFMVTLEGTPAPAENETLNPRLPHKQPLEEPLKEPYLEVHGLGSYKWG